MSTEVKWLAYLKEECILLLPLQDTHLIDCVRVVVAVLGVDGKLMSLRREGGGTFEATHILHFTHALL